MLGFFTFNDDNKCYEMHVAISNLEMKPKQLH